MVQSPISLIQRSLNLKVLAPLVILSCVIGTVSGLISRHVYHRIYDEEIRKRTELLADTMVHAAESCSSLEELSQTIDRWRLLQDVTWIAFIANEPPQIVVSTQQDWMGVALSAWEHPARRQLLAQAVTTQNRDIAFDRSLHEYLAVRPLSLQFYDAGRVSAIRAVGVGLNTRGYQAEIRNTLIVIIFKQLVTIFLIAILAYWLLKKLVLYPTQIFNQTMLRRTEGDRTAFAPSFSPDEIGSLARHLNTMLETLDESQIRVNTILNTVEDGIITSDVHGIIQSFNHAAEVIFGYQASETIGRNVTILMPPEIACEHDRYLREYQITQIKKVIDHNRELEAMRKDGTRFPIALSVSEMKVGEKISYVGTIRDITRQKEHVRAIHQRIALEQLLSAISSRFVSISPERFERELLRSLREIGEFCGAERCYVSIFSDNGHAIEHTSEWCAPGIEPQLSRMQNVTLDKFCYYLEHMKNNVTFYVPQVDDLPIQAANEMEECRKRGVRSLIAVPLVCDNKLYGSMGLDWIHQPQPWIREDIVFIKTIGELLVNAYARHQTVEQLRVAKESAESAAKTKAEFLANMSHEIRTPLNGVMGMLSLALDSELTPAQHDYLDTAQKSAESLLQIINDILDFSKIDAGKLIFECVPFHLREMLEDLCYPIAMRAQKKGIEFFLRYAPTAPSMVIGDAGRIRQVITNLAENAVKFTESGQVSIDVTWETQPDNNALFHISTCDTGIGISEEKLASIFDQFMQADTSTTRKYGGTGLGLAISKQLVELMGGTIGVTSRLHEGSTFQISLPLPLAPTLEPPAVSHPLPPECTVLFVSENELNATILSEQLRLLQVQFSSSASFEDAVSALHAAAESNQPYRIVILGRTKRTLERQRFAQTVLNDSRFTDVGIVVLSPIGDPQPIRWNLDATHSISLEVPVRLKALHHGLTELRQKLERPMNEPLNTSTPPSESLQKSTANLHGSSSQNLFSKHVLLVEDSKVNQRVAKLLLERLGLTVDVANHGNEAVAMSETRHYDAIIMDCQMPELDGFEATQIIRRREAGTARHVPIIALTAHAMQQDRDECLAAGMDDYLSKPIIPDQLQQILLKYLCTASESSQTDLHDKSTQANETTILYMSKSEFNDRFGGDWELLREMIDLFLQHEPEYVAAIQSAVERNDAAALKADAHRLKGSIANFGTGLGYQLSSQLELAGKNNDLSLANDLLRQLLDEMKQFRATGKSIVTRQPSS